ncbi:ABC transporter ATP-binding protein [Candidatus Woesearchaeota archaeon]|nr:ABC transporter ATP-binding protein [Candidatus Woesearchaeota archaeon]
MVEVTLDTALAKHVETALASGRSREEVRVALISAGWPASLVNGFLDKVQSELGPSALVRVSGVSKRFGEHVVLDRVNLEVRPGEILGIVGKSGCGKTTLLKVLAGVLRPETGDVVVQREQRSLSMFGDREFATALVGLSTQSPSVYDKLTARENVEHFGSLYGIQGTALTFRASAVLKQVDLFAQQHQLAEELSGGQKKRLDIACAIMHKPRVLVLDEPVAELDPSAGDKILSLVKQINEAGTTVVLASHVLPEMEKTCHRIAVLRKGAITECMPPEDLRRMFARHFQVRVEMAVNDPGIIADLKKFPQVFPSIISTSPLVALTPTPKKALRILSMALGKSKESVRSASVSRPGLGDVFDLLVSK